MTSSGFRHKRAQRTGCKPTKYKGNLSEIAIMRIADAAQSAIEAPGAHVIKIISDYV